MRERRVAILECLLGLVENWLAAGRPQHADKMGGFENWSEIVGGILGVNGFRAWRTNEAEWQARSNPKGAEMQNFVSLWHTTYGDVEVTSAELLSLVHQAGLFPEILAKRSKHGIRCAFGQMLRRHVDTPIGKWVVGARSSGNQSLYRLEASQ